MAVWRRGSFDVGGPPKIRGISETTRRSRTPVPWEATEPVSAPKVRLCENVAQRNENIVLRCAEVALTLLTIVSQ